MSKLLLSPSSEHKVQGNITESLTDPNCQHIDIVDIKRRDTLILEALRKTMLVIVRRKRQRNFSVLPIDTNMRMLLVHSWLMWHHPGFSLVLILLKRPIAFLRSILKDSLRKEIVLVDHYIQQGEIFIIVFIS